MLSLVVLLVAAQHPARPSASGSPDDVTGAWPGGSTHKHSTIHDGEPRRLLLHQRWERLVGAHAQLFDLDHLFGEISWPGGQLLSSLIVRFLRLAQVPAHLLKITDKANELVVGLRALLRNRLSVSVLVLVALDVGDRPECGHHRRRAHEHHVSGVGIVEEGVILRGGQQEGRLDGDEQQHEVGR